LVEKTLETFTLQWLEILAFRAKISLSNLLKSDIYKLT
jgi:hypothetical protein